MRETVIQSPKGGKYLVTFDPFTTASDPSKQEIIDWDVRLAVRLMDKGNLDPQIGTYRYVNDFGPLIERIKAQHNLTKKPVAVAMDTEDMTFWPWYAQNDIVSISFTLEVGTADILYLGNRQPHPVVLDPSKPLFDQITWLLTSPMVKLRMANGKFDLIWIAEKWGIECTNFTTDTLLIGSLLNENRSNSLNLHAKLFTTIGGYDDEFNRTQDKGHMELIKPDEKYAIYAGGDTDACQQTADVLVSELVEDEKLAKFYKVVVHPAARAFEKLERTGILVDQQKYAKLRGELAQEIAEATGQAMDLIPNKLKLKHRDKIESQTAQGKSPLVDAILRDYFFTANGLNLKPKITTPKTGAPSMAKHHLRMFHSVPEAVEMVKALTAMDGASKTQSTFVDGFLKHLRPDGRFHSTYMLFHGGLNDDEADESGTVSGRLAAKNPAIQCCVGSTLVETDKGQVRIDRIVSDEGKGYKVRTHTGALRDVMGVYRNGVRSVFWVGLASGKFVICTANHPLLTTRGWTRTDKLRVGDVGFIRKQEQPKTRAIVQPGVSLVGGHEEPMLQPYEQRLAALRGSGHQLRPGVGGLRDFPGRHGAETSGDVAGSEGQRRGLLEIELPVGSARRAGEQSVEHPLHHACGADQERRPVGAGSGHHEGSLALSAERRDTHGRRPVEIEETDRRAFQEDAIVSITPAGFEETFDLTIDRCHSFVANGIVVHNTLPKKTKYAKRLRECFIAPPGKVILGCDYSQGELKVVACIAPEKTMIQAYMDGLDLHAVTGAALSATPLDVFLSWKDCDDKDKAEAFDLARAKAKPANFGLLYGMGVEGFQAYAWANYGMALSYDQAEDMRNKFFSLYPGLLKYHDKMREFVRFNGHVRSPLGRIRHLPTINAYDREVKSRAERQAINSPVQSALTDMMIWAISIIQEELGDQVEMFAMIHDAFYAYVDADKVQSIAQQVTTIMGNLPLDVFNWKPQLRFTADAEYGTDMASMYKMKLAA